MKYATPQKRSATMQAPAQGRASRAFHDHHDAFEEEAERTSELVLTLPENAPSIRASHQLRLAAFVTPHEDTLPSSVSRTLSEPGQPLEPFLREDMERRFGYDFSRVRVHAAGTAANSALDVNADAYTVGHHIVFAPGHFTPDSRDGRRLIAHELTHVVQQSRGGVGGTTRRVLQRRRRPELLPTSSVLSAPDTTVSTDETGAPISAAPTPPTPAPPTPEVPTAGGTARDTERGAVATRDAAAATLPLTAPTPSTAPVSEDASMPSVTALLGERRAARPEAGRDTDGEGVDMGELLGVLALGAREARNVINTHAGDARSSVDRGAKRTTKRLDDQRASADAAVRALTRQRHAQIDMTVRAHQGQIDWQEKLALEDATTYAGNATKALEDGFKWYRDQLAEVFDGWSRRFAQLKTTKSTELTDTSEENIRELSRLCNTYIKRYIDDIGGQSEGRRDVQRDAARDVLNEYTKEFRSGTKEIVKELAKACDAVPPELNKARDQALTAYDEALPAVLKDVRQQLAAAQFDIRSKAREARKLLTDSAVQIHARVRALEEITLNRYAALGLKVGRQIEERSASAQGQMRRATPQAMEPIATVMDEAVGLLTNTNEELDPNASRQFVDEVFEFSLAAADATGDVFAAARDASLGSLADAVPFVRRGLTAGKEDLETTLRAEGAETEAALINLGLEAETYIRSPLADLDQTYLATVTHAEAQLTALVSAAAGNVRKEMVKQEEAITKAVNEAKYQQRLAVRRFPRAMHTAAGEAAWRYDHDILKYVVDVIEVTLGVAVILGLIVGFILLLPVLVGKTVAGVILVILAMLGAFAAGYFGAKAYDDRRKAGAGRVSALLGAVAEVTGLNEVRRAFTDAKMKPFERGLALGGLLAGLFGAGQGAKRFLKAVKLRLPKTFTNPFRPKQPVVATTPETPVLPGAAEAPVLRLRQIGFELPHQKLSEPDVTAPKTPKADKIGFDLPHQKLPEPEMPQPPVAPKPQRVGFELPHQTRAPRDVPAAAATEPAVTPRLHHRKPAVQEPQPTAAKRKIGFARREEPVPVSEAPARVGDRPATSGEGPATGGVISEMPRARVMRGSESPRSTADVPEQGAAKAIGSSEPTTPRPTTSETSPTPSPTKGSAVSTVEPEVRPPVPAERRLSPDVEARLADERAIQVAREKRLADETRVAALDEKMKFLEEMRHALGRKRKRDYFDDEYESTKNELKQARRDLRESQRAENQAEADQRIHLLRQRDVDPAAARYDPKVKEQALQEIQTREARVRQNEELIKANEPALAKARARVAAREKEFDATRPGSEAGPQSRALKRERERAQLRLDSARRHMEAVEARTAAAYRANQNHIRRMQELDRVVHPDDYPELSGPKGNYAEQQAHNFMDAEGYTFKGSSKQPGVGKPKEQGLDGVYEKTGTAAEGPPHVVGESKYHEARLRKGQETPEWVDERLDTAVGPRHANRMREEGYEYWVMKYDPKIRRVRAMKLWEFRPNGKRGPGGKPLGDIHYFPPS